MPRYTKPTSRDEEARLLRALRDELGLSQREMAVEFGVTSAAIAQWESGARTIPGSVLRLMDLYAAELGQPDAPVSYVTPPPSTRGERSKNAIAASAWLVARTFLPSDSPSALRRRILTHAVRQYVNDSVRLRGLTMKWAQLAWTLSPVLLEPEREALAILGSSPPAMSAAQVAQVFFEDFQMTPREAFSRWTSTPFSSASIGQVHAAKLRSGEPVAVKVQYPRVVALIEADLENLRSMGRLAKLAANARIPDVVYATLQRYLVDECDYRIEASNHEWMRSCFERRADVHIPRVIAGFSTRHVLTTELARGKRLDEFIATSSADQRDRAGATIWSMYYESALRFGGYNTDPNPGNFLFDDGKVTFLDFGRVQRLSADYVGQWRVLVRAILENDPPRVTETLVAMGYVADERARELDPIVRFLWLWTLPCLRAEPFVFTREYLLAIWRLFLKEGASLSINYKPDMVFLTQFLFGVGGVLATLGARIPCRGMLLDLVYAPGEPLPPPFTDDQLAWLA